MRGGAGQSGHQAVVGPDDDRLRGGDDRQEPVELPDLGGQGAVVAVGDDEVAVPGERGQFGAGPAADRPDLVLAAGLVDVGGDRVAGGGDRVGDGGVELVALAGLEQQHRAEQVAQPLVELVALLDLLDEDVLVADDAARLVGGRGDLGGVDHAEHPVGDRFGAAGDPVGDRDVAEGGEATGLLEGRQPFGRRREGLLEAQPGGDGLGVWAGISTPRTLAGLASTILVISVSSGNSS
ncbi:hypothetical protein GCM10029992_60030 [Glycomyces albus]